MIALRVLLVTLALAGLRGEKDYAYRWALAEAIVAATDDEQEQDVLARIAWYESGYRRNVARCEIKGDKGKSLGAFQVQPIDRRDVKNACGSLVAQADLALRYVRLSAESCPGSEGAWRLARYVSGRCDRGYAQAKMRWGSK